MTYPHSVNGVQLYITRLLSLPQFSPIFSLGKCTVTTVSVGEDCHCTVHSTNSQFSLSVSVSDISISSSCQSVRRLIYQLHQLIRPQAQRASVHLWAFGTVYTCTQQSTEYYKHVTSIHVIHALDRFRNKETTGNIYLSVLPVHCRRLTAMNEALVVSLSDY